MVTYAALMLLFIINSDGYWAPLPIAGGARSLAECNDAGPDVVIQMDRQEPGFKHGFICIDPLNIRPAPRKI